MKTVERAGLGIPYAVDGDGSGPALVFAHGLMETGASFREALAPLVSSGWTIVTFDQRGHGSASPVLDARGYDPAEMGADLWAVADEAGIDACWIGGGSMGAATSFRAAQAQPERVQGLVQAFPAWGPNPHELIPLLDGWADDVRDGGIGGLIASFRKLADGDDMIDSEFLEQLKSHDARSLETALRAVARWTLPDIPAAFAALSCPVVVFGAAGDPIHPIGLAEEIAAAAQAELFEVEPIDVEPTRLGGLVSEYLGTRLPTRGR